jgi:hypothetical protein
MILFGFTIPAVGSKVEAGLAIAALLLAAVCAIMLDMGNKKPGLVWGIGSGTFFTLLFACGMVALVLPNVSATDYAVVTGVNFGLALASLCVVFWTLLYNHFRLTALTALPMGPATLVGAATLMRLVAATLDGFLVHVMDVAVFVMLATIAGCIVTGGWVLYKHYRS